MNNAGRFPLFPGPPRFEVWIGVPPTDGRSDFEYRQEREYYSLPTAILFAEGWNSQPEKGGEALVLDENGNIVWQEPGEVMS